jgi:predicted DsbA family dithiol-disulfide isomerase/uncharacterized membrane protein
MISPSLYAVFGGPSTTLSRHGSRRARVLCSAATMPKRLPFWTTIAVSLLALAASAVLLVDYVRRGPVFCDGAGGCSSVRQSALAYPFGVPLPVFGLAGLLAIALAALVPGRRARISQATVATGGAIVALGLVGWQVANHTLCPYCMAVDGSMVVLAGLSIARALRGWDPPIGKLEPGVAIGVLLLAIGAPLGVGFSRPKPISPVSAGLPDVIAEELRKAPRGKVTVVDFIDFECPFCRMTHKALAPLLAAHAGKVHVVRKNVPLRMHAHAMDAAKAACCAEEMGQGDAMADALASAPAEALTTSGCEDIASSLGLDRVRFHACVAAPETEARIKADAEAFRAAKGHGLPTLWIGETKLEGAQDAASLTPVLDAALRAL